MIDASPCASSAWWRAKEGIAHEIDRGRGLLVCAASELAQTLCMTCNGE
jgi:hypothetical protein